MRNEKIKTEQIDQAIWLVLYLKKRSIVRNVLGLENSGDWILRGKKVYYRTLALHGTRGRNH
jgi:hypothetical protein